MKPNFHVWPLAAQCSLCAFFYASCQYYDPFTEEEIFRGTYERNFIKTFGEIAPDQSWDFSKYAAEKRTTRTSRALMSDDGANHVDNEWYEVNSKLFKSMTENAKFTEKADQRFALELSENDCFTIFPVFRSSTENSGLKWSLQVMIDQENMTSSYTDLGWPMGTNMLYKSSATSGYKPIGDNVCNSWGVLSKYIVHVDNLNGEKKYMYFNLIITGNKGSIYNKYAPIGTQQSSLDYQMRILEIPKPDHVSAEDETLFIACEAANFDPNNPYTGNYGRRYQSLILMLVGPQLPKVVYLDETKDRLILDHSINKRYMIEDMGSSSDFDFNDVVVDVSQSTKTPVVIQKEHLAGSYAPIMTHVNLAPAEDVVTTASVKYICGTKPFQLTVGNHVFGKVTDPTDEAQTRKQLHSLAIDHETFYESSKNVIGWSPNETEIIDGWLPEQNNISIKVWRNSMSSDSDGGWQVQFPKVGEVPFIMALPENTPWNEEGINFTGWQQFVPCN